MRCPHHRGAIPAGAAREHVLYMVNALAAIGTAAAIFSVAKRVHEGFALGFVTTRLLEAAIIAIGVVGLLGLLSLRQEGVAAVDTGAAVVVGRTVVAVRDWTFVLGPSLMPALNALHQGTSASRTGWYHMSYHSRRTDPWPSQPPRRARTCSR